MNKNSEKELRNLVGSFKHIELRNLLGFAKRNNNGKKSLLLDRVYEMIDAGCTTSIAFKINEIHANRELSKSAKKQAMDPKAQVSELPAKSGGDKHQPLINVSLPTNDESLKECPLVKFVDLPFYEQMEVIVKPVHLKSNSNLGSSCTQLQFHLSPQQTRCITEGQELVKECMIEYKLQIIMRFCSNVPNVEQDDDLPPGLYVSVNNKVISLPSHQSSSLDLKRTGRPLDITHACNLTLDTLNNVIITWNQAFMNNYCFTIVMSKKMSCNDLLEKLKNNSLQNPEYTRSLIREKLSADADTEISTTSLKISLICPLGKVRLTVPARSLSCSHLQCFDASTYLQMNEKKPTWICPICDRPAKFKSLVIDGLFSEILSKVDGSNEIQFFEDGNWKPLTQKRQEVKCIPNDSLVCLDVPDSPCSSSSADTIVLGSNDKRKAKENKLITMVDLTADSDSDDESLFLINGNNELASPNYLDQMF